MKQIFLVILFMYGCNSPSPTAAHYTPAHAASEVANPIQEFDLPVVHLTQEAVARLGIETSVVKNEVMPHSRLVGGEVVVPPGRTVTVTAPVAGMVKFLAVNGLAPGTQIQLNDPLLRLTALAPTDRDTRARVAREVAAAEANLAALELRVTRNQALVAEQAGSVRALEEAIAARDVAKADLKAARSRSSTLSKDPLLSDVALVVNAPSQGVVRTLSVAEGQSVPAGAPMLEIVMIDALQVRIPVYSGDLGRLDTASVARVQRLGESRSVEAIFVTGPPTAEPDRNTVDHYLALPPDADFTLGERVLVALPFHDQGVSRSVPTSAIVLDAWGGAWVYLCNGSHYTRARVNPLRRANQHTMIAHGPQVGACVVSVGAAEIFGTEFPPGH